MLEYVREIYTIVLHMAIPDNLTIILSLPTHLKLSKYKPWQIMQLERNYITLFKCQHPKHVLFLLAAKFRRITRPRFAIRKKIIFGYYSGSNSRNILYNPNGTL